MSTEAMETLLQNMSSEITRERELVLLVQTLEDCKQQLYSSKNGYKKCLQLLPTVVYDSIPAKTRESQAELDNWLSVAVQTLQQVPVVTLAVAYVPTIAESEELIKLLRTGFDTSVVVAVTIDRSLLAGARISVGSKQIEVSIKQELAAVLATAKGNDA